jgi:hypothetical protein
MTTKDAIKYVMDTSLFVVNKYLSDLGDADLLVRPAQGVNHIAWQLGHLIESERSLVESVCPGSSPALPEGFAAQHAKETAGVDDPKKFLSKQQYLDLFAKQRAATLAALAKLSDADLDRPGPERMRDFCPTVGSLFCLVANHPMMHAGQLAVVRRVQGKPVVI